MPPVLGNNFKELVIALILSGQKLAQALLVNDLLLGEQSAGVDRYPQDFKCCPTMAG